MVGKSKDTQVRKKHSCSLAGTPGQSHEEQPHRQVSCTGSLSTKTRNLPSTFQDRPYHIGQHYAIRYVLARAVRKGAFSSKETIP